MYLELTMELCSTFHLQTVMTNHDDPGTIQFRLGGLVRQLSVPEFSAVLGLYMRNSERRTILIHSTTTSIILLPSVGTPSCHIRPPTTPVTLRQRLSLRP
ncbi:hypothetical protein F383_34250 [Gossypium arboreum]|uniref:Uncharacterized protein n=1 Tax=Gossypium arboreum TaxID=29729 RepID=A0A0B0PVJ2_GOSAR|nr:hypothetical protein F383_34250 [Gossypium arboreum]